MNFRSICLMNVKGSTEGVANDLNYRCIDFMNE